MNDRELLELAGAAVGMNVLAADGRGWPREKIGWFWCEHGSGPGLADRGNLNRQTWNPLKNDGEALQVAVKLGMDLSLWGTAVFAKIGSRALSQVSVGSDKAADTRRAIVSAAAQFVGAKTTVANEE